MSPVQDKSVKLTEVQKLKFLMAGLKERNLKLEKVIIQHLQTIAALRAENLQLRSQGSSAEMDELYKEIGIDRADDVELHDDGTLVIIPARKQPEAPKGNGSPAPQEGPPARA